MTCVKARGVAGSTESPHNLPQLDFVGCADAVAVAGILAIMVRAQCHEDVLRRFLGHAVNNFRFCSSAVMTQQDPFCITSLWHAVVSNTRT